MNYIINLFNHYGYLVLLISLILELIAFPLPGEALMTYCGYLVYMSKMSLPISILVAASGAIIGVTISHFVGKWLGASFFEKHGHYIHFNKKRMDIISVWFQNYGSKLLIVAYFIPGVRHVTGYFSGITNISYKKFAINSYIGALIWSSTFIILGKVLGVKWEKYHRLLSRYLIIISFIIALIIIGIYIYKKYKQKLEAIIFDFLKKGINIFHSLGRIKLLISGIAVIFLIFSALFIGIIQDYLENEFGQFDDLTRYLISRIFDDEFRGLMTAFSYISKSYLLTSIAAFTLIWIIVKGKDKIHEVRFLFITIAGAYIFHILLERIFQRTGPTGSMYTFPSYKVLMATVVYGIPAYLTLKHSKSTWFKAMFSGLFLVICLSIGLSIIYFNMEYPSDVVAGFEFGVLWLSLMIILMEIYKVLPKVKKEDEI